MQTVIEIKMISLHLIFLGVAHFAIFIFFQNGLLTFYRVNEGLNRRPFVFILKIAVVARCHDLVVK